MTADLPRSRDSGVCVSTLQAPLARVESGTGEDRELCLDVHLAFVGSMYDRASLLRLNYQTPAYLTSFDAAMALVARVWPGCCWRIYWERSGADGEKWAAAELFDDPPPDGSIGAVFWAKAKTETRALIAALIRAEIAAFTRPD